MAHIQPDMKCLLAIIQQYIDHLGVLYTQVHMAISWSEHARLHLLAYKRLVEIYRKSRTLNVSTSSHCLIIDINNSMASKQLLLIFLAMVLLLQGRVIYFIPYYFSIFHIVLGAF